MNTKRLEALAKSIVFKSFGRDIPVKFNAFSDEAYVNISRRGLRKIPNAFYFGLDAIREEGSVARGYINKHYPITEKYDIFLFVILHEIGHCFDLSGYTKGLLFGVTNEEYRELPDEKFADTWAADFMTKNPDQLAMWNKLVIKAME